MRRYGEVEMTDGGTGTLLLCHRVSRGAPMMPVRYFHGPPRINLCRVDDLTFVLHNLYLKCYHWLLQKPI